MTQYHETLAHGVDVSHYQSQRAVDPIIDPDFDKIALLSEFSFIRMGQNNFLDARGKENWKNAKGAVYRGGYWFYDWRSTATTPEQQGALFLSAFDGDLGELPPVMDFEKPWGNWTTETFPARDRALDLMQRFKSSVSAEKMILYINQSALKTLQPFPDWLLADWYLWIAAPPLIETYPGSGKWTAQCKNPRQIPDGWKPSTFGWDWTFWQYTWNLDGLAHGVQSLDLDGNLFNGTPEQLADFASGIPIILPDDEPEEEEPMTNKWKDYPIGASVPVGGAPDVNGDFVIVELGADYENINSQLGPQVDAAHAAGIPAIGVFRPDVKDYVQKTEGIYYENWKPDEDPFVNKLWYKYYLDRLVAQGVDAVMLDLVITEGSGVVMTSWYIAVAKYYINLMSNRYDLPSWFLFLRTSDYDKLAAKQVGSELDDFLHWAGSVCGLKIVDTDPGSLYPIESAKPDMIAPAIDFWLYDVSGASPLWLYCNGNKSVLYAILNWNPDGIVDNEPDNDPTIDVPVIGDLSEIMDALETIQVGQDEMNGKLDRILEFIEAVKDA